MGRPGLNMDRLASNATDIKLQLCVTTDENASVLALQRLQKTLENFVKKLQGGGIGRIMRNWIERMNH